jgi:hypothetical protein
MAVINSGLNGICSIRDWSERGVVNLLDHACRQAAGGEVSPLVRLLWEGMRWLRPGLAAADRWYKTELMVRRSFDRFQEGALLCFTGFEVLRMELPEEWAWPRLPVGDEVRVEFEVEGVCMRPLLRRTPRGIVAVPGTAVLLPFTILRIGRVSRVGGVAGVSLSCVGRSYWLARRSSRLPCGIVEDRVERQYHSAWSF